MQLALSLLPALFPALLISSASTAADEPAATPAATQTAGGPGSDEASPFSASLTLRGTHAFKSDLDSANGSVSVTRARTDLSLGYTLNAQWRLSLGIEGEGSFYNFKDATGIFAAGSPKPFNDVYSLTMTPTVTYIIDRHWSVRAGGAFQWAGEPDAHIGASFMGGGLAAVRYAFDDSLAIGGGLLITSRLDESAFVIPALTVEWQITPTIRFATERLGGRLTNQLSDDWSMSLFGGYQIREYRLAESSPQRGGVIRDRTAPIGVSLDYSPTKNIKISLSGGAIVYQKYRIDDSEGREVSETNTRPAPFIGLSGEIRF